MQRFIEAGYDFLDEKRTLLAARLLEELALWRRATADYAAAHDAARVALRAAIARHGVDSLEL